jgi:NADH-quinone oxidoreductase subunit G
VTDSDLVKITIDGVEYDVPKGRTIMQALDEQGLLMNGVDIPHYCWHPKLSVEGSCRLCQVEVEGAPKLQIGCNTPVNDGMVVHTNTPSVTSARQNVMELLLLSHPLDCPICDQAGECQLQDYAYDYGRAESRSVEPRRALKKRVDLGPTIVFDQERCILCRRCVRFCREVAGTGELAVFGRGDRSRIDTFPGGRVDNPYSLNVVDICPVGALTSKDFRFKIRAWYLKNVPGICPGCAKGCNIEIGVAGGKVYRYVPRRNDCVNDTWMCDAGRLSYEEIGRADRLREPMVRGADGVLEARPYATAIEEAAVRLGKLCDSKGAGVIAGVASTHASNEDLFMLQRLLAALGAEVSGVAVIRGEGDALLVEEEKGANAAGARALGFADASGLVERLRGGGVDGMVILGHDLLDAAYLGGAAELEKLAAVVVIDTHHSELERVADVVLPARHAAEKLGTFTNCDGRVQRVCPAVEPAFEARYEGEILADLGEALLPEGFDEHCGGHYDVRQISKKLSEDVPVFAGNDLEAVGDQGRELSEQNSGAGN